MSDPITVELLNPIGQAFVGEPFPLHLVIRCPEDGDVTVLRAIKSRDPAVTELDADLFERDTPMRPGEVYRCTVVARFVAPGLVSAPPFVVIAGEDKYGRSVRVPTPPIRVVPSLLAELHARAEPICTYDTGTKVDVTLIHGGPTRLHDFRLTVGPADAVRAGVSDQRRPSFAGGEEIKFTTVVAARVLTLELDAAVAGERVGPVSLSLPVPEVSDVATVPLFQFLEPKKLTQAEVRVRTFDEERTEVSPVLGQFTVLGGGYKYGVEVKPAHSHATGVKLRGVSGVVEVAEMPADAGTWAFQMVVLSNAVFTTSATLHFDVLTPEGPQQGELSLSIRPRNGRLWAVAMTAGAAVTVKGLAAIVPSVLAPGNLWESAWETLAHTKTLWDLAQLLSIPVIRAALWAMDHVFQPFQDD